MSSCFAGTPAARLLARAFRAPPEPKMPRSDKILLLTVLGLLLTKLPIKIGELFVILYDEK